MFLFYNITVYVISLLVSPIMMLALPFSAKLRRGFWARFGFHPRQVRETFREMSRPRVWIHAASMGEIAAITPVAKLLKERNPEMAIVISTVTLTGFNHAHEKMPFASSVILAPLDYPGAVKRVMKMVEPNLVVIAETELWPNFIRQTKRRGSQLALINGRMSEKSFKRYTRIKSLLRRMLDRFDLVAVQTEKDGERFRNLGANPQRLKVIGNVKFDVSSEAGLEQLREELRLIPGRTLWVAGSTRPGEEEIILDAFSLVQARVPNAVLILAVRHLERLGEVKRLLAQRRLAFTLRSRVSKELLDFPVILLDTMGELSKVYGLGQVAFVGGSLAPFGGHNPLEPAALGVPVLLGPHTEHFAQVSSILVERGGAQVVRNANDLAQAVIAFLTRPDQARQSGERAQQAVSAYQGAAMQTVDLLQKLMLIKQWAGEVKRWRQESLQNTAYPAQQETLHDDWPEW